MSVLTGLLEKAQNLQSALKSEGNTVVGDVTDRAKDLVENLQHEVDKETGGQPVTDPNPTSPEAAATGAPGTEGNVIPAGSDTTAPETSGVQTSSDLNG